MNWNCEKCGRPCRRPDETWDSFEERLPDSWAGDYWDIHFEGDDGDFLEVASAIPRHQRFTLTMDGSKAWCSACCCWHERASAIVKVAG